MPSSDSGRLQRNNVDTVRCISTFSLSADVDRVNLVNRLQVPTVSYARVSTIVASTVVRHQRQ